MDGMIRKSIMAVAIRGARRSCRSQRSQDTITRFRAPVSFLQHASAWSAVPELTAVERELNGLEAALRRLENEYNMYFGGQLPRPPWESRRRVEALLRRFDRALHSERSGPVPAEHPPVAFLDLCGTVGPGDARARGRAAGAVLQSGSPRRAGAGRPAPTARAGRGQPPSCPTSPATPRPSRRSTSALLAARRAVGTEEPLPFDRFAEIVKGQVSKLQRAGSREVAFRVTVKDGKVAFTAQGVGGIRRGE